MPQRFLRLLLLLMLPVSGCSCSESPSVNSDAGDLPGEDAGGPPSDGGPPDLGGPPPDVVRIELDPSAASLITDGLTPAAQTFAVLGIKANSDRVDLTDRANFDLADDDLGMMSGPTFTSALFGGQTELTAQVGTLTATASIVVRVEREVVIGQVPNDPGRLFEGATDDPGRAPTLVYPNDGVLLPLNLGAIEVHYRPGPGNTLFELRFENATTQVVVYTSCAPLADGCFYALEGDLWDLLARTNRGDAPITVSLRGTDAQAQTAGSASPLSMRISPFPVSGGLYYWTTSNGSGIMRVDFGQRGQTPERFFPFEGKGCYGCHAISRNGRMMSLSQNGQRDGRITLLDIANRQVLVTAQDDKREQFQTWSPDSTRFAGVWADSEPPDTNIRIRDGRTAEVIETIPIGMEPDHPDWSPNGERILFAVVTRHQTSQRPGRAGLSYVQALPGGGWGPPTELIAPEDGMNRYYPAYAPDGQFFLYNESTCPNGEIYNGDCDADADPSAKLWAMLADGGAPLRLERANAPGVEDNGMTDLSNTFPKWAPFVDPQRRDGGGRLMWFTFSSRRQYGLRSPNGIDQLIWMAAIDPDQILAGQDGSFTAFALPFQDLSTSNHIAQWTTQIVPPVDPPDGGVGDGGPDAGGDGGLDPMQGEDAGVCLGLGETCDPDDDQCCAGSRCAENGPGIYLCRPDL